MPFPIDDGALKTDLLQDLIANVGCVFVRIPGTTLYLSLLESDVNPEVTYYQQDGAAYLV